MARIDLGQAYRDILTCHLRGDLESNEAKLTKSMLIYQGACLLLQVVHSVLIDDGLLKLLQIFFISHPL